MYEVADKAVTDRAQDVYRVAQEKFERSPDWVSFYREVLGVEGCMRTIFRTPDELTQFEQTPEYQQIQQMVAKLRERNGDLAQPKEPTRVITVRLPQSLHDSLRTEAHEKRTSMNKLCISKLLQMIDEELIPSDT
ncbi:MAG: hypothetical protein JNM18_23100 [Planctomycetaceae bacterium]|nr:hypothetical protein [Planctomycetaceae bacterium]